MEPLGQWISNMTAKPFYMRKEFCLNKTARRATAYVCGLGQFHFYLNGKKVGDHELDPGWTNYNKLVQYVVFDVSAYLAGGTNAIGIEIGNGWYHMDRKRYYMSMPPNTPAFSFMPPNPNPYQPFSDYLALGFKLAIDYEDGSTDEIISDHTWKTCPHFVQVANVFGSEIIDGKYKKDGFSLAGYRDETWEDAQLLEPNVWPKGKLVPQVQPPIKVKKTYTAQYLQDVDGHMVYDFGQNMSGILEFDVKGKSGDIINIYPAEKLGEDGNVDQMAKGWTPIDVCITYVVAKDDVWETCRMKFTYFAGRYIAVQGAAQTEATGLPCIRNISGHYITSACKETGLFSCDDRRLEQIYDLVLKSVECNLMSVHTDCPTIERYAWQEPNHLMGPSIMYMKDVKALWKKILTDLRVDQCTAEEYYHGMDGKKFYPGEGMMPSQAPCYEHNVLPAPGLGSFFDVIPWGSTCILAVYWHYMFYGDKKIIEDNYEAGKNYLKYLKTKVTKDGFINHGLGDWGNPDKGALVRENVETAFLYADAMKLGEFAEILGKENESKEFYGYARQVKDNYNERLLVKHPTKGFYCYRAWDHPDEIFLTQACEAMPLYFGLVPEEKKEDVVKAFRYVLERDNTFISGEIGLPYIIQTMADCGMNEKIIAFILKEKHPSYYAFVLAGETTLGEYWEDNPRSHNHDMMGHIVEWYYNGIAGIKPLRAGFKEVLIKPYLPSTATSFTCSYDSVQGKIQVKVKELQNSIQVEVQLPKGVTYLIDDSLLRERKGNVVLFINSEIKEK